MRRRHDNNSSHCSCIPTSQGLPRYYFYFYKLLCIWITKLRDSLFKKKKMREEEERRGGICISRKYVPHCPLVTLAFSLPCKHPRPVPAPGPLHLLFSLSGMLLSQRARHTALNLPAHSSASIVPTILHRTRCCLTPYCFMVPERPPECQRHDSRDFFCFVRGCVLSLLNNSWHTVGVQ